MMSKTNTYSAFHRNDTSKSIEALPFPMVKLRHQKKTDITSKHFPDFAANPELPFRLGDTPSAYASDICCSPKIGV